MIPKHHIDFIAKCSFFGPVNTSAMFTTRIARDVTVLLTFARAPVVNVNVNNEFQMRSIGHVIRYFRHEFVTLKKIGGPMLLLFHIPRYFTTVFNSDPILWAYIAAREPLVPITKTKPLISDPRCSPAFVRVEHESTFGNKIPFSIWFVKVMPPINWIHKTD